MEYTEASKILDNWFDILNKLKFENTLSKPIITIASDPKGSCYGWCTTRQMWHDGEVNRYEINMTAETLNRTVYETVGTLLHEMVHLDNIQRGIQDCSRGGTYHNKKFKTAAEEKGLIVEPSQKYGWAHTKLHPDTIEQLKAHGITEKIPLARLRIYKDPKERKSNVRKYVCQSCGCSCRATKDIYIMCLNCEETMMLETD